MTTCPPQFIEHEGVIDQTTPGVVSVRIEQTSACAHCHAKGACAVSDTEHKVLQIKTEDPTLRVGDKVKVLLEESLGPQALLLGYVYPFLIVFLTLFVIWMLTQSELWAGLGALLTLIPYYAALYFVRKKIEKKFIFRVKKI